MQVVYFDEKLGDYNVKEIKAPAYIPDIKETA